MVGIAAGGVDGEGEAVLVLADELVDPLAGQALHLVVGEPVMKC